MPRWKKSETAVAVADVEDEVVETAPVEKTKMYTDWSVFDSAGVKPVKIVCDENPANRAYNQGCHTALLALPETFKSHLDLGHSGSFRVQLADDKGLWKTKDKKSQWERMGELGLELHRLQCDTCDSVLRLTPATIKSHMRVHTNKNRRMTKGEWFWITVSYGAPDSADDQDIS